MKYLHAIETRWYLVAAATVAVVGSVMLGLTLQKGGTAFIPFAGGSGSTVTIQPGSPLAVKLGGGISMEFVWIPSLHGWAGKYEVSNAQYARFRPQHRSGGYQAYSLDGRDQPVVNVPYADGMEGAAPFAKWLTERLHAQASVPDGYAFRLPTTSEWATLARCGHDRAYPWGNEWPPTSGNFADRAAHELFGDDQVMEDYRDGFAVTCPVQQSGSNEWGLFGLAGNVWEWTSDEQGSGHPLRGGSWLDRNSDYLQCDSGYDIPPSYRFEGLGFRLVLMADLAQAAAR